MFCEEIRVPGLPGVGDVADGSVDYYDMDWPITENGVSEEEMPKCRPEPCGAGQKCEDNTPQQTDDTGYEIIDVDV